MKLKLLMVALLLMSGVAAIAHEYENTTGCKSDCSGTCQYSDGPNDQWHSGGCTQT
jgi:hypothetical protein